MSDSTEAQAAEPSFLLEFVNENGSRGRLSSTGGLKIGINQSTTADEDGKITQIDLTIRAVLTFDEDYPDGVLRIEAL